MKSEDIKQKIVDKKLSDVVDLVEDKPKLLVCLMI